MTALLAEDVEMTLDAAGLPWTRRDHTWAVAAPGAVVREIRITPTEAGVHLDAVLIEWDEATPEALEALSLFLTTAGRDVPGVGCSLDGTRARLSADVAGAEIEHRLGEAVRTMSAGCRLLAGGARALLASDLARQYLSFLGASREGTPTS